MWSTQITFNKILSNEAWLAAVHSKSVGWGLDQRSVQDNQLLAHPCISLQTFLHEQG